MSRLSVFGMFLCLLIVLPVLSADDAVPSKSFQEVADFVESNLIGKTLETAITSKISDGSLETEFTRRTMYTHFVRTNDTMQFDAIILIRQNLWDLDASGARTSDKPTVRNRAIVIRYGVQASLATGKAIGTSSTITNTAAPTVGSGTGIQMTVHDGKLKLVATTPLYSDGFAKGGGYKPIANTDTTTFVVEDGNLSAETVEHLYNVDPETLERTLSDHQVTLKGLEIPGLF